MITETARTDTEVATKETVTRAVALLQAGTMTYDFEHLMKNATLLSCSEFGKAIIDAM